MTLEWAGQMRPHPFPSLEVGGLGMVFDLILFIKVIIECFTFIAFGFTCHSFRD